MNASINRRHFLRQTSICAAGVAAFRNAPALQSAGSPNNKVVVGIIGCNSRGLGHIQSYLSLPNVEIAYICDVDTRAIAKGVAAVGKRQPQPPKGLRDLRRLLDDPSVDAVSIATPDHWHAPATVLACAAGKHVYVEKPGSHNIRESQMMVAAARKYKRTVQMGNQRRSWPWVIDAIESLKHGELGALYFARGWYTNHRVSIGHGKEIPVPSWLDYTLWQGPAPERPFRDNVIHYNWHWFWHWGTGELGNNGVHALDLARWGLGVGLPRRVTCGGGRYFFNDDWETPDTATATFDFGNKAIFWEGQSCAPRGFEDASFGVGFYGEGGSMALAGNNCKVYDLNSRLVRETGGKQAELFSYDAFHFGNFIDSIRTGSPLAAEIEEGQKSTHLCHLGNIAWRTGHTVNFDPGSLKVVGDKAASALCRRSYRRSWEPRIS